jgi:hypothetical protein
VNSQLTEDFVACFARLPDAVKAQARKSYRLWRDNPFHPSLHFKRIHAHEDLYAVRVARPWACSKAIRSHGSGLDRTQNTNS